MDTRYQIKYKTADYPVKRIEEAGLQQLTSLQQQLLVMAITHTYADIASIMGIPLGTVKSRIHRARAKLNGDEVG